jgi:hypothetical protein
MNPWINEPPKVMMDKMYSGNKGLIDKMNPDELIINYCLYST